MNTLKNLCYLHTEIFVFSAFRSCSDDDKMMTEQKISPDAGNPSVYYDIIHTKADHKEP